MMHQDSDKLTAEVEDQIRDADRPVERVVQLAFCNRPIARHGLRAYSPYPIHCIVVVCIVLRQRVYGTCEGTYGGGGGP